MDRDQLLIKKITQAFPEAIKDTVDFRGETTLYIRKADLKNVCQLLRDDEELQYNFLTDIVADDMLSDSMSGDVPRFAVNYHLNSLTNNHRIRLRTWVEDPEDGPETVAPIWAIATWLEMEVWDLMGIRFKGNDSLRRLFLPEDWQGHPLRKDYPLGYEEVQFTFNFDEIDAKKPHATRD